MTALGEIPGQSAGLWRHAKSPILYFRDLTSQGHGIDVRREVKHSIGANRWRREVRLGAHQRKGIFATKI
jgi:hypothetical protein